MIVINDDTALEHSEQFNCTLTLVPPILPHIQLNPSVAIVTIIDNDSKHVNLVMHSIGTDTILLVYTCVISLILLKF